MKSPIEIAKELGENGRCICPNFLSKELLHSTSADFDFTRRRGLFSPAGVGRGNDHQIRDVIRNDETFWLDRSNSTPSQSDLLDKCEELQQAFNQTLFMGLTDFSGHYARYAEAGYYKKHRDAFKNSEQSTQAPSRMISLIIYLNADWKSGDGGRLRVFTADSHEDIDPVGGTLVCFLSQDLEHEVLQSHSDRSSFTGWFTR